MYGYLTYPSRVTRTTARVFHKIIKFINDYLLKHFYPVAMKYQPPSFTNLYSYHWILLCTTSRKYKQGKIKVLCVWLYSRPTVHDGLSDTLQIRWGRLLHDLFCRVIHTQTHNPLPDKHLY